MSLEQSIQPFVNLAKKRAKQILDDIESVQELVNSLESKQMNAFTAA